MENPIKQLTYLFSKINWADSTLDAQAIHHMNTVKKNIESFALKVQSMRFKQEQYRFAIGEEKDELKRELAIIQEQVDMMVSSFELTLPEDQYVADRECCEPEEEEVVFPSALCSYCDYGNSLCKCGKGDDSKIDLKKLAKESEHEEDSVN